MKACPHCRAEFEDNLIYCTKDGSPLIDTEAPTADDIEIDTVISKTNIPAVVPIEDLETQGWEADEFAETQYSTRESVDFEDAFEDPEVDDFGDEPEEDQSESVGYQKPIESEEKRSYLGLIIGAFALFGIFILGAALVGAFLYYQSQNQTEIAASNTNQESDSNQEFPDENVNGDLSDQENSNIEDFETDDDIGLSTDSTSTENRKDSDSEKDKSKDKEKDRDRDRDKDKTSKTEDTRKTGSSSSDSKKGEDKEVRFSTPTPERRTTPTPARTPRKTPTPKPRIPSRISGGVVNGKAVSLPVPAYPSAARSSRVTGTVNVQVVISRTGKVLSARATNGHPLLRSAAVSAARRARFRPTMLSGQPVEVSGVIVYNFRP